MQKVKKESRRIVTFMLAVVLAVNCSFTYLRANAESADATESVPTYANLTPSIITSGTSWNKPTAVTFYANASGIENIPNPNHRFEAVNGVIDNIIYPSDSGLYRNGVKSDSLYLQTVGSGGAGSGKVQMAICLDEDTDAPTASHGDIITIKGQFKHATQNIVLEFVETSFVWDANQSTWRTITSVTYDNLDAILYTGSQTSKTCKNSVSFHVDTSGIGTIPLHQTYTPTSQDVENGIYRNGELEKELYLYTYYSGTDTMQFYIGLDQAESAGASAGDIVKIQGQFAYLDISTGKQYVLSFNECEFVCETVGTSSTISQDGYDWVAVAKPDFENLQPKHFAGSTTYNTASYVSFSVTADELYTITQLGGNDWETFSAVQGTKSGILYAEESGIFKNGQLLENARLWAVDPINSNAGVQFIIDLGNNAVTAGDLIMITGQFKYSNCLLEFDKAAFEYLGGTGGSSWKDAEGITIETFKQMFNQYDSTAERWDLYFYLNGTIAGATENAHYNNLKVEVINPEGIRTVNNVDAYWISGNVLFIPLTKAAWGVTEDLCGYQIIVKSWCGVNDDANSWIYLEEDYCLSINEKGWNSNGFIVDAKANVSDIELSVRSGIGDEHGIYFTDKNDKMTNFTKSWQDTYYAKFGPENNLRYPTKSGVYINGIRNADIGIRWTSEGFYLLLTETGGYTAMEGDVITIQGFFQYGDTSFQLNEYSVQFRNCAWTEESLKVVIHIGEDTSEITPGIMMEYILPEVPESYDGWMIEGDSSNFCDAGDSLSFTKDIELRAYKLQDGDCNHDGSTDVRDLVRIRRYQNNSSSVTIHTFNADLNANGRVDFDETNSDEQKLRSLLITDEVTDYHLTAYKNDDAIEFSAYQGPRRAGAFGYGTDNTSYVTQEQFLQYKEAGFDYLISEQDAAYGCKVLKGEDGTYVVKGGYPFADSDLCDYMNLAEGIGLDVVVLSHEINAAISGTSDEEGKAFIRQMLVDLFQYQCFKGIMLIDEPTYTQATQYAKIYNMVMEIAAELDPERELFLLAAKLPMYATEEALTGSGATTASNNTADYQTYINAFAGTEDMFMYDSYPLMHRGTTLWTGDYIHKTWFSNLQTAAKNSDQIGIVLQSSGFRGGADSYVYNRDLNEQDDIDWQVNTSLAFGVREISYYSYWPHWGLTSIQHTSTMVDATGTKTAVYAYVQNANDILKKFDHVLAKFDWKGTAKYWANADSCFNSTATLTSTQLMDFDDYSLTGGVTASVRNTVALIGEFQDDLGTMAYYVTNAAAPEMNKSGDVSMQFGADVKGAIIYHNGIKSYMRLTGGSLSIELASGEGVFVIPMQ